MNRRITTALAHLTAAAVVAIVGPAPQPPTAAATAATPAATESPGQHCAVLLDTGKTACAATEQAAARLLDARVPSYRVAKLWQDAGYRGRSLTYYMSRACTTTHWDHDATIPVVSSVWNDKLSSLITDLDTTTTRCTVVISEHGRFYGRTMPIHDRVPNLGAFGLNDKASSWYIT